MSNAFAPQDYDPLDEEFDVEADYVDLDAAPMSDPAADTRPPLQFTAPSEMPQPPMVAGGPVAASGHFPRPVAGLHPRGRLGPGLCSPPVPPRWRLPPLVAPRPPLATLLCRLYNTVAPSPLGFERTIDRVVSIGPTIFSG